MSLPRDTEGIAAWLARQWSETVVEVLEAMTGERPTAERALVPAGGAAAAGTEGEEVLWWEQGWSLGPQALLVIGAPLAAWRELGTKSLIAAGIEAPEPADIRSTYCELLSQGSGSLARRLTDALGREVTAAAGAERPAAAAVRQMFAVRLSFSGAAKPAEIRVGFSAAYLAALQAAAPPVAAAAAAAPNMDLLLDVELPVTVSFGRTQLLMRDVLKLTTGSIVELNRAVNEMVDVVVNNCVVARGEVVVVEGNYGVRVQQILSRQQRLQTLQ